MFSLVTMQSSKDIKIKSFFCFLLKYFIDTMCKVFRTAPVQGTTSWGSVSCPMTLHTVSQPGTEPVILLFVDDLLYQLTHSCRAPLIDHQRCLRIHSKL